MVISTVYIVNAAFMLGFVWLFREAVNQINNANEPGGNPGRAGSLDQIRNNGLGFMLFWLTPILWAIGHIQEFISCNSVITEFERAPFESFLTSFTLAAGKTEREFLTVNTVVALLGITGFLFALFCASRLIVFNISGKRTVIGRLTPVIIIGCWFWYFLNLPHRAMFQYPILTKMFSLNSYFEKLKMYSVNGDVMTIIHEYSGYAIIGILVILLFLNIFKQNNDGK